MTARRVAVTGIGVLSSLGCTTEEVARSLRESRSGVVQVPEWAELGLTGRVAGLVPGRDRLRESSGLCGQDLDAMTDAALLAVLAARQAVADAGLAADELADPRTGCLVGSGISGTETVAVGSRLLAEGRARRISPYTVLRAMSSSAAANVALALGVGGRSYAISSACASSAHAVGHAFELIRDGRLEVAIAGGTEEANVFVAAAFSALRGSLASRHNDAPELASRPFAADRDGFVLAEGAGLLVLEDWQRATARRARIRGEILGFGATSDRHNLVSPPPDGAPAAACMTAALTDAGIDPAEVGYVNAHATGTPQGDLAEGRALASVFGARQPPVSSTKSLGGHALGAAGALELIHCLLMLEGGFLAPSANLEHPDPKLPRLDLVTELRTGPVRFMLSNNFGFGGSNASLVLGRR